MDADFQIPCGKCRGCLANKRKDWAIRMYHESLYHEQNCFLTLTYATPPEKLSVPDTQRFMRKLIKRVPNVRYFMCGEYGEKTGRPHYHAVIFGADFLGASYPIDGVMYGNKLLENIWGHGQVTIGNLTMASACYVAGYVNKKLGDTDTFQTMSKRPPIGYQWAVDNQDTLRRNEKVIIEGSELPIPKVYFEWSECTKFRPMEVDLDEVKANRTRNAKQLWEHELRSKEINQEARQALGKGEKL